MFRVRSWHWTVAMFAAGIIVGGWLVAQEDLLSWATGEMRGMLGVPAAYAQEQSQPKPSPTEARDRDVLDRDRVVETHSDSSARCEYERSEGDGA